MKMDERDLTQMTPGLNRTVYDFPPYSHSQPFIQDVHGQKRFISPESQMMTQFNVDKRLRHNSLEYVMDASTQQSQQSLIRKVTLEDLMRGIDNLGVNTAKKEDLKDLATKQDLLAS